MKNIRIFYLKIFIVLVVKFSVYLNRHVFVMSHGQWTTRSGCMPAVSFGGLISSSVQSTVSKPSGSKQRGPGSDCRDEAAESDQVKKKVSSGPLFQTVLFITKKCWFFLISPWKQMLWVLIGSASLRCFQWIPTTFSWRDKETIFSKCPCYQYIWSYEDKQCKQKSFWSTSKIAVWSG